MKRGIFCLAVATVLLVGGTARAQNDVKFSAKAGAKKVLGDLVPSFKCAGADTDRECSNSLLVGWDVPDPGNVSNVTNSSATTHNCTFTKGKFKSMVGKEGQAQIQGLSCAGVTPAQLCAQVLAYNTIANKEIDSKGGESAETCSVSLVNDIAGTSNFTAVNLGTLTCDTKGTCKGTLTQVAPDPCDTVDKIQEIKRVEVMDGPDSYTYEPVPGALTVGRCCQNSLVPPGGKCVGANQEVLAVMGSMVQTK